MCGRDGGVGSPAKLFKLKIVPADRKLDLADDRLWTPGDFTMFAHGKLHNSGQNCPWDGASSLLPHDRLCHPRAKRRPDIY
jgi:hypothetical protein